jgi:hypothetical protein
LIKTGENTDQTDSSTFPIFFLSSLLASSYLWHSINMCSLVASSPHSQRRSGDEALRNGLVALRSLTLSVKRERRVAFWRGRECSGWTK